MSDKKNYNFTQYPKHVKYYGQKLDRLMISHLLVILFYLGIIAVSYERRFDQWMIKE